MKNRMLKRALRLLASLALTGAAGIALADLPVVTGEPSLTPKSSAPAPKLRLAAKAIRASAKLSPVADSELQEIRRINQGAKNMRAVLKRFAVGVVRGQVSVLPTLGEGSWVPVPGGYAAQASVTSPEAGAMRLAIDLANVPLDVEMVFYGSDATDDIVGPIRVGDIKDRSAPWWSPTTDGETQVVEFFAPARANAQGLSVRITAASHLFTTVTSGFAKTTADIGSSGSCEIDIKCSSLSSSGAFLDVRNAVAHMLFQDGASAFLCTGTLLNDTAAATQVPWFYGANHCFDNDSQPLKTDGEMQVVGNSLNTFWFFEATSCNARGIPPYVRRTNGAQVIYHNSGADVLLLRLNDTAPSGAFFAGWDPNPVPLGTSVITIHHPRGDLKKVSQGTVQRYSNPPIVGANGTPFSQVLWSSGSTEGGSSGAGFFTFDGAQYLLRGGLWGGSALCTNPAGTDNFSRFDLVYPAIAQYLSPTSAPATDYTDMWWNPDENGWGLNLVQHPNQIIFAVWYTYDENQRQTWYSMSSGTWTSINTYEGTIYTTAGPGANASFDPNRVTRTAVGTGRLTFSDANHGTWSFTINGISGSKTITRIPY
jgi:lysyl endopeptidase